MNTIPLIFNEKQLKRTVIGGTEFSAPVKQCLPISVILLNRDVGHYKSQTLQFLSTFKFKSIVSVEQSIDNYALERFANTYPHVKFLIPLEEASTGELINMSVSELDTEYVLVLWNNTKLVPHVFTNRFVDKIVKDEILCQVPILYDTQDHILPVEMVPKIENSLLRVCSFLNYKDSVDTLYAFDYMGIYHREKFMQLGGFDYTITNPYWQKLDFFFRSWLWGEKTKLAGQLKVTYQDEIEQEDSTADESYLRFYIKNIAPQFNLDHGELPKSRFFGFKRRCPYGFVDSLTLFKDARNWVEANKYRFRRDAKSFIDSWGHLE